MFFKKNKKSKKEEIYRIAFCDENDLSTVFGYYDCTFKTYETADHIIRMNWNKERKDKIKDGYKIKDAWLVIEKSVDVLN